MNWVDLVGYVAAALLLASFWMKTIILLRVFGIASNVVFIIYAAFGELYPILILHVLLLPLNAYRLWEMLRLIEDVKRAARGQFSMEWALPYAQKQRVSSGEVLFNKGDEAEAMFYLFKGRARIEEFGVSIGEGEMVGEIALFCEPRIRTATVVCDTDCEFLCLSLDTVRQLYFQNPTFGFYLVHLITGRLVANLQAMQATAPVAAKRRR